MPDGVTSKVHAQVKRRIQEYATEALRGTYTGIVRQGGHDWPWEVRLTRIKVEVIELEIDWGQE